MVFEGPTRPGTDVEEFRRTGRSVPRSGRSRRAPSAPSVSISGNTVFINGQGFSVAPSQQAEFIRNRTGGSGSSARAAITQANKIEEIRLARETARIKQIEKIRADLIRREALLRAQGARITRKKSIDSKTKQRLVITETTKGSEKIRQITNLDTGDVTINRLGASGQVAGITVSGKPKKKTTKKETLEGVVPKTKTTVPKLKDLKVSIFKIMTGKKLTDKEALLLYKKYDNVNMQNAKALTLAGPVVGTIIPGGQIPGAAIWALGEIAGKYDKKIKGNEKLTKKEVLIIARDAAIMGAIFGAGGKILKSGGSIIGKRIILGSALKNLENQAARAALNHGGVLIKFIGYGGKNLITTYFMKDMVGNVFDVTVAVKNKRFNSALRSSIETGSSIGGYIGGSKLAGGITGAVLLGSGRLKATSPEFAQKKTQLDVVARQLFSKGKIVLTRRGVYETGKGLSPRQDAWLDSKVKNPTKSIFWRFDKTLSKKDQAISPLPLFTKGKTGYIKMFNSNWKKNKGLSPIKRYLKTTAETPLVDDVVIRQVVNLKDIKNTKLRKDVIKQYATTGKLNKATQEKILKNPKFGISDKNREFGFHDENEFVTRTAFKFKGRKDISWTYDPTLKEYVPVVESLKTASKRKNILSVLQKKKIITRTDAKFIADNYAIKKQFKSSSILPNKHSYTHMKQVEGNIVKLMNKYPQYNSYWKKQYGSVAKAREAMKQAMWHDIGKGESASQAFGTAHGEKVWNVWKAKLLPKGLKFKPRVAKAIKKHETLDPRKLWYKVQNRVKLVTPEQKIVATADRLDLVRFGIKVDAKRLPLGDALTRLNIKQKDIKFPSSFSKIIAKIKIDKGVTKADLKKVALFLKSKVVKRVVKKRVGRKMLKKRSVIAAPKRPAKRPVKRPPKRPVKRPPKRPTKRPPKRPVKRPPKRPAKRPPRRPPKRPPKRPPRRPPARPPKRPPKIPPRKKPPIVPGKSPGKFTKRTISKAQPVYYIKVKKKGRIVNLAPRPLILRDAKDYLAYKLDKNLVRTAYFEPIGRAKKVVRIPKQMQGYFTKAKSKLRPYKIRVGKKKLLRNGYIEKRKFALDTKREKAQLERARAKRKKK